VYRIEKRKRIIKQTNMSRRKNGVNKSKVARLNEINLIDSKMRRNKYKNDELAFSTLEQRRKTLCQQMKGK
jgi:hypothetical protein